jgi:phosphoribosylformylglycinamidine synthase
MVYFFQKSTTEYFAIGSESSLSQDDLSKITWLLSGAQQLNETTIEANFIGPRKEMLSPWCSNALDIFHNCGIHTISRVEPFIKSAGADDSFDQMLQQRYSKLDQLIFQVDHTSEPIKRIEDLHAYNQQEGLALSDEEVAFLEGVSKEIKRPLTDSEVFGFSQINSEHCRHKIFNGEFIIDGETKEKTLFQLIKDTAREHPNLIVSAYKDNVAFIHGPMAEQFAPEKQDAPNEFETKEFESVISLKAETHNFPTTVEPFNGAATGSGGEIRDRMAGGQGSIPLAGTAVYMTSYSRLEKGRDWENEGRKWLYQSPKDILIKASNGASDYGNKFGQPLICGSVLTFEHEEGENSFGFDKVIMMAGGIGFGKLKNAKKQAIKPGQKIVVMGGDNYRIGMGGSAVSSVDTGAMASSIELNAVQRSNPEMQKRVANAIRSMVEMDENTIVSIHDHGAGGHLNCLSELVEDTGGAIHLDRLPIGDKTLSEKEILGNESQERMGLVIDEKNLAYLTRVAARERAPIYEVGEATDNHRLSFMQDGPSPFDLATAHMFGSSPKTVLEDNSIGYSFAEVPSSNIETSLEKVLQLEAVACKDWLTNKVDRCVTGKVAHQQTVGEIQVPLNNVSAMAIDYKSKKGIATSIGHAPVPGLIQSGAGSRLSVTEALSNLVWAPLNHGLQGVSLSANWMWPAKNPKENNRLYEGVQALSEFAIALGINVPTGKDSLSMTQKYPDGKRVLAPGTVIVSSVGEVSDVNKIISPALKVNETDSELLYVDFSGSGFHLGGSSYAQVNGKIGTQCPDADPTVVWRAFTAVQDLILENQLLAGHDVSAGGLITTLLEMNFPNATGGMNVDLSDFDAQAHNLLFSEKPALVLQVKSGAKEILEKHGAEYKIIGSVHNDRNVNIKTRDWTGSLSIEKYRSVWRKTSDLLDQHQTKMKVATQRTTNYSKQPLSYSLPKNFTGTYASLGLDPDRKTKSGIKAAIIREQGVNSDREMAYAMWLAGFDVKDVHMTDLITGREDLTEVNFIVFVGGFSNSDVLGSAKGWAGSFKFNEKAKTALENFYKRPVTLSLGVCNGCQLMMELDLIYPEMTNHPKMHHNVGGKFECSFLNVDIEPNNTVMLGSMAGTRLGIWMAHGEGQFQLENESDYLIPVKYSYDKFPGNPNGSSFATAALASKDGRHLAIMPHLERSLFPWNWAHKTGNEGIDVTPWMEPFINAKNWVKERI